jgi:hypothetical protein
MLSPLCLTIGPIFVAWERFSCPIIKLEPTPESRPSALCGPADLLG